MPPRAIEFQISRKQFGGNSWLTHRRLPDRKELVGVASGWHAHVGVLIDLLNGREPEQFWSTIERMEAEYDKRLPA